VLLSDPTGTYGFVVDAFRGEQDLVVRPLDPRLGKVPNLSAAAVLDDGSVITWGNRERQQLPPLRAGLEVVDIHIDRYRTAVTRRV